MEGDDASGKCGRGVGGHKGRGERRIGPVLIFPNIATHARGAWFSLYFHIYCFANGLWTLSIFQQTGYIRLLFLFLLGSVTRSLYALPSLSALLSVCVSVSLSIHPLVRPSGLLTVQPSDCLTVQPSDRATVQPCFRLSVYLL